MLTAMFNRLTRIHDFDDQHSTLLIEVLSLTLRLRLISFFFFLKLTTKSTICENLFAFMLCFYYWLPSFVLLQVDEIIEKCKSYDFFFLYCNHFHGMVHKVYEKSSITSIRFCLPFLFFFHMIDDESTATCYVHQHEFYFNTKNVADVVVHLEEQLNNNNNNRFNSSF